MVDLDVAASAGSPVMFLERWSMIQEAYASSLAIQDTSLVEKSGGNEESKSQTVSTSLKA